MEQKKKEGIPSWIKKTAAILGILATATTIFTGIYAIFQEWQKTKKMIEIERTKQQQAIQAAEKAKLQQKKIDYEINKERTRQKEAEKNKILAQLEMLKSERERELEEKKYEELKHSENQLFQSIEDLTNIDRSAIGSLTVLKKYATQDSEYKEQISTALSMRAKKAKTVAEIELIFQLYDNIGAESLNKTIVLNRYACNELKKALLELFWIDVHKSLPLRTNRFFEWAIQNEPTPTSIDILRKSEKIQDLYTERMSKFIYDKINNFPKNSNSVYPGLSNLFDPNYQILTILNGWTKYYYIILDESYYQKVSTLEGLSKNLSPADLKQNIIINAEILSRSKSFIEKYLNKKISWRSIIGDYIDLSQTYLVGIQINKNLRNLTFSFEDALIFNLPKPSPTNVFPRWNSKDMNYEHEIIKSFEDENFIKHSARYDNKKFKDQLNFSSRRAYLVEYHKIHKILRRTPAEIGW